MRDFDIDTALAIANPLTLEAAERLELQAAERELLDGVRGLEVPARAAVRRRVQRRPRARRVVLVALATTLAAAVFAVLPSGHRDTGGPAPAPAFAAELVRFANASPLIALEAPGWHVTYANEESAREGELSYVRGPANRDGTPRGAISTDPTTFAGRGAGLQWHSGSLRFWVRDRANDASQRTTARVLGSTAQVFVSTGTHGYLAVGALWSYEGRVIEFGAPVRSLAMFLSELHSLRRVSVDTWLRALPPSVVKTAQRRAVIEQMLRGIPLPPGFDAAQIHGAGLVENRYQLGAAVTGTVTCTWFADWVRARRAHDGAGVREAVAAMATAPRWAVLRQMERGGDWPSILIAFAKAMPAGNRWHGQSLASAAGGTLGCRQLGVGIP